MRAFYFESTHENIANVCTKWNFTFRQRIHRIRLPKRCFVSLNGPDYVEFFFVVVPFCIDWLASVCSVLISKNLFIREVESSVEIESYYYTIIRAFLCFLTMQLTSAKRWEVCAGCFRSSDVEFWRFFRLEFVCCFVQVSHSKFDLLQIKFNISILFSD